MSTIRYARVRIRHARVSLMRLDPALSWRRVWTLYGHVPGSGDGLTRHGRVGTGL